MAKRRNTKKASVRKVRNVPDEVFWAFLRNNNGNFARTARKINEDYGKGEQLITRQGVRQRAMRDKVTYQDIIEEAFDLAEEALLSLLRSTDERVRLKAAELFLTRNVRAMSRGWYSGNNSDSANRGNTTNNIQINVNNFSVEELKLYRDLGKKLYGGEK